MNGKTRLSEALAASPEILEYVISLNPHDFNRLRNPLLRKVMPPRINLRRVAVMTGIPEQDFVDKINQLAGLPQESAHDGAGEVDELPASFSEPPEWLTGADEEKIRWVDVLSIDDQSGDPMPPINVAINTSKPGDIIGIKHRWEPQPFYDIWHTRGFEFWAHQEGPEEWHIFVRR